MQLPNARAHARFGCHGNARGGATSTLKNRNKALANSVLENSPPVPPPTGQGINHRVPHHHPNGAAAINLGAMVYACAILRTTLSAQNRLWQWSLCAVQVRWWSCKAFWPPRHSGTANTHTLPPYTHTSSIHGVVQ